MQNTWGGFARYPYAGTDCVAIVGTSKLTDNTVIVVQRVEQQQKLTAIVTARISDKAKWQ